MIELEGKYAKAKIFTDLVEPAAISQVMALANLPYMEGASIRMMPDVHPGKGCTIGTTFNVRDRPVCPDLVGCDIGCGMLATRIEQRDVDPAELDAAIRSAIPAGAKGRPSMHGLARCADLGGLRCGDERMIQKALSSVGTLGGGNHFIELDRSDADGSLWLVVHSGSRSLGLAVSSWYMSRASCGRQDGKLPVPKELGFLDGDLLECYLHDVGIVQRFASLNRNAIAFDILVAMGWRQADAFETVHNYVDLDAMVLRKGAVSAKEGERLLIPLNMRDGALLCSGKGNPDWNFSAPHGAGRIMGRGQAKRSISLDEFRASMAGIYTTSVSEATIDESPMAYKPAEAIVSAISPTADIVDRLSPVYNFKAGGR